MSLIHFIGKWILPILWFLNSFLIKILILFYNKRFILNAKIIILFTIIYYLIYLYEVKSFSQNKLKINNMFSFTNIVHFTLGFRIIFPVSNLTRIMVLIHKGLFWIINFY